MSKSNNSTNEVSSATHRDDLTTLRLKLRTVDHYIKVYETHAQRLGGKMYTQGVLLQHGDPSPLLQSLTDALVPISEDGVSVSLIAEDLAEARRNLGGKFATDTEGQVRQLIEQLGAFRKNHQECTDPDRYFNDVMAIAAHLVELFDRGLIPARVLRKQLMIELAPTTKPKTPKPASIPVAPSNIDISEWPNVTQAAARKHVHKATISRAAHDGRLTAYLRGKEIAIDPGSLKRWKRRVPKSVADQLRMEEIARLRTQKRNAQLREK